MKKIITKEKGDTGLIQVISDLDRHNIKVALPISEHLPFDLIAINENAKLSRISVKYVSIVKGSIPLPLRSISTNMKGWKAKTINFEDIDAFAIFCPNNLCIYYINSNLIKEYKSVFSIRVEKSNNLITSNLADKFIDPKCIFNSF